MPATYVQIASSIMTTTTSAVTFSAIPNSYTDLVLKCSARGDYTTTGVLLSSLRIYINATYSGTIQSYIRLTGNAATVESGKNANDNQMWAIYGVNQDDTTASTFASSEIYIPSYTVSQNKPFFAFSTNENNGLTSYLGITANLFRSTSAVSTLEIYSGIGSFVSGSSFFLYGIKNS